MMKAVISSERFNFAALEGRRFFLLSCQGCFLARLFFILLIFANIYLGPCWCRLELKHEHDHHLDGLNGFSDLHCCPPKKWELEKALFFHKPTCNFPGLKNLKNEGKNHFFWPRLPKFTRGKNIDFFSDFENVERKPFLHLSWVINFWGQLVAENSLNDDGSEKWTNLEIESISLRSKHQQRCYSQ